MIPTLYQGSVKNVLGPVVHEGTDAVVFHYSNAYSVFDWGRMPDELEGKGEALALMMASLFERLETPEEWQRFSVSGISKRLQELMDDESAGRFQEIQSQLTEQGLKTHYLGVLTEEDLAEGRVQPQRLSAIQKRPTSVLVRRVSVVHPEEGKLLGKPTLDYGPTRKAPLPKLIPLEVVFRLGCPKGSSLLKRLKRNPNYLSTLPIPARALPAEVSAGAKWEFPLIEPFTKLEPSDRPVTMTEGLALSGLSVDQMEEMFMKSVLAAGFLQWVCEDLKLELWDGKLEWGLDDSGEVFLVDAIGPDELRILKDGVQLSKEFLRTEYEKTPWHDQLQSGKAQASEKGEINWKPFVPEPPALHTEAKQIAAQIYPSIANLLLGRRFFEEAWEVDRLLEEMSGR